MAIGVDALKRTPLYDRHHIVAFATGKPSEAFGDRYRVFDEGRQIARLPADPYRFVDRIMSVSGEPWVMVAGGKVDGALVDNGPCHFSGCSRDAIAQLERDTI